MTAASGQSSVASTVAVRLLQQADHSHGDPGQAGHQPTAGPFEQRRMVRLPSGATVWARMADGTGSGQIMAVLAGYQGDSKSIAGFRQLDCCTDLTNMDPTTTFTLPNAGATSGWKQIIASTVNRVAGLILVTSALASSGTLSRMSFDVGIGSAGNEKVIFSGQGQWAAGPNSIWGPFPCDVKAGSRLSVQLAAFDTSGITGGAFLYGLVP